MDHLDWSKRIELGNWEMHQMEDNPRAHSHLFAAFARYKNSGRKKLSYKVVTVKKRKV